MKRILMLGINTLPELTGIGKYSGEMAEWLADQGYECTVISTPPYYPQWKIQKPYTNRFYQKEILKEGKLIIYRCPFYVPSNPSGLKRVLHEGSFFFSAFFVVLRLLFKPGYDRIFCVAPPFHLGFLALFYRFFKGGTLTYHIQDLQIEAARDLKVLKPDQVFSLLFAMERYILKKVDRISTISIGMQKKIEVKSGIEVRLLPNWADTEIFYPIEQRESLKSIWGFSATDKVVLYSGSIGEKQGLEILIDCALNLAAYPDIRFVICGTGPYRKKLEKLAIRKKSPINFIPLQPMNLFNQFLNMADVHLVIQKGNAGDLVMPSKLMTLLAAGALALVTARRETSLFDLVDQHQIGILAPPEDSEALCKTILDACHRDHSLTRRAARDYAEKFLSKDIILESFIQKPAV